MGKTIWIIIKTMEIIKYITFAILAIILIPYLFLGIKLEIQKEQLFSRELKRLKYLLLKNELSTKEIDEIYQLRNKYKLYQDDEFD
jgi:hypothetical protein